jgi:Tfp pilus assembly pilus retraction ATPase PilT
MDDLNSLMAVLELTGGARIVLRSDERPHVIVGDTRHELGTAQVPTTSSLEALADQILSPAGKHALAEQRAAVESLPGRDAVIPVRVAVRRIGPQMSVELQRNAQSADTSHAAPPTAASMPPAMVAGLVSSPEPPPSVSRVAEPGRARTRKTSSPMNVIDGRQRSPGVGTLEQLVRMAAQRKATALYLRGGHAPLVRVGALVEPLAVEPLEVSAVNAIARGGIGSGDNVEHPAAFTVSVSDADAIRQFRAHLFNDELGAGVVVHLVSRKPESILQTGIPPQVKGICRDDDGIVVVSATTNGDLLEMIAGIGSWTAKHRPGFVISIEPPGGLGRDIVGSFVSARRIAAGDMVAAIKRAAHETPDVLLVAPLSTAGAEEAVRVARMGSLVIVGIIAPTATRAIESLLAQVTSQDQLHLRRSLAASFRCAFSYRALRTGNGHRRIFHDLVAATPNVSARIEHGDIDGIGKMQQAGAEGMRSLDSALVDGVARDEISIRQAAFHAIDRRQVIKMIRESARRRAGKR